MFGNPASVANFFAEESRGAVALSGQVFGWYNIAATQRRLRLEHLAEPGHGQGPGGRREPRQLRPRRLRRGRTPARAAGPGWATCPGRTSWNNGSFDLRVLAHELSHNFGTNHASTLQCTQGATIVSLSATCSYNEYGDPFSVMGSGNTYHNDGEQVGELGWLRAGELATVVPGGTYAVTPLLTGTGRFAEGAAHRRASRGRRSSSTSG